VPYAWTWNLPGGGEWRFTLPVYPLFLISAAVAVETGVRIAKGLGRRESRRRAATEAARFALTAGILALSARWTLQGLDWLRVSEAVSRGLGARIEPGPHAAFFFPSGWTVSGAAGARFVATLTQVEGLLRLPVPPGMGARIVLRLGSTQERGRPVEIFLGARRLGSVPASPDHAIETIEIDPAWSRTRGGIDLRFLDSERPANGAPPLVLLWVRIEPLGTLS
jgi:hypothetical protein